VPPHTPRARAPAWLLCADADGETALHAAASLHLAFVVRLCLDYLEIRGEARPGEAAAQAALAENFAGLPYVLLEAWMDAL